MCVLHSCISRRVCRFHGKICLICPKVFDDFAIWVVESSIAPWIKGVTLRTFLVAMTGQRCTILSSSRWWSLQVPRNIGFWWLSLLYTVWCRRRSSGGLIRVRITHINFCYGFPLLWYRRRPSPRDLFRLVYFVIWRYNWLSLSNYRFILCLQGPL